ncbi:MAG TPA: hypothetical protein VGM92_01340 [Candidatus Kapabacteria bacterium]|jgi:hypothetical protein
MKFNTIIKLGGSAILGAALIFLSSCSSTTRTSGANYYPYGSSNYSVVYTPPSWAPANVNLSNVRYYYLPDCDAYYDASSQQFYSQDLNGSWSSNTSAPTSCSNLDLSTAYTVLLNSNASKPWLQNSFYQTNYPIHSYDVYGNIVLSHNLLSDLPANYSVTPRAFNENTNSVIFTTRDGNGNTIALRDVPMGAISTYMPSDTRSYYYGGGYPSR